MEITTFNEIRDIILSVRKPHNKHCDTCKYVFDTLFGTSVTMEADALCNAGYRRIPDGTVIITAEEYNELKAEVECLKNECDRAVESLNIQRQEIEDIKAENEKLRNCDFVKKSQKYVVKEFAEGVKNFILSELFKESSDKYHFAKVVLYYINRRLNDTFGLNEPLNAANQFLAEPELIKKYGINEPVEEKRGEQ